jgi:hypothetical protein
MFRAIIADNFPPFGRLDLDLPSVANKPPELGEVHLFTGVNGTGKTRLLSLIAAMLDNAVPLTKRMKGVGSSTLFAVSDKAPTRPIEWELFESAKVHNAVSTGLWNTVHLRQGNFNWISRTDFRNWLKRVSLGFYARNHCDKRTRFA